MTKRQILKTLRAARAARSSGVKVVPSRDRNGTRVWWLQSPGAGPFYSWREAHDIARTYRYSVLFELASLQEAA